MGLESRVHWHRHGDLVARSERVRDEHAGRDAGFATDSHTVLPEEGFERPLLRTASMALVCCDHAHVTHVHQDDGDDDDTNSADHDEREFPASKWSRPAGSRAGIAMMDIVVEFRVTRGIGGRVVRYNGREREDQRS